LVSSLLDSNMFISAPIASHTSPSDADDAVQETARVCLDMLRARSSRREELVGVRNLAAPTSVTPGTLGAAGRTLDRAGWRCVIETASGLPSRDLPVSGGQPS
jgi:hypothetical protein